MSGVALQAGVAIDGRYALVQVLGVGTFGIVWRATDLRTNRSVAVKFLRPEFANRDEIVDRFTREAHALAAMNHPNVVSVIDLGAWHEHRFIVMEYVEGESLGDWIATERRRSRVPPVAEVSRRFDQICRGVAAAHIKAIVHRDIKPANVLLNYQASGEVIAKVGDFGIAQLGGRHQTETGMLLGTREYMAPEQLRGQNAQVGAPSDVFALGVVLLEMLTGRFGPDVPGDDFWWSASMRGQTVRCVGRLAEARPDVPRAVWSVVVRALAEEPAARPANADALRRELEGAWGSSLQPSLASGAPPRMSPAAASPAQAHIASVYVAPSLAGPLAAGSRAAADPVDRRNLSSTTPTYSLGPRVSPAVVAGGVVVVAVAFAVGALASRWGAQGNSNATTEVLSATAGAASPPPPAREVGPPPREAAAPQRAVAQQPPVVAPQAPAIGRCVVRMDAEWPFHLRATDTPSRAGARNLPGGLEVEVLQPGYSWRDGAVSRTYLVRILEGEAEGSTGYVFLHPADLATRPECPR